MSSSSPVYATSQPQSMFSFFEKPQSLLINIILCLFLIHSFPPLKLFLFYILVVRKELYSPTIPTMTRRYQRICHLPCDQVYVQGFEERCDSLRRRRLHLSWNRGHRDELGWKRVARGVTGIRVARGVTGITFGRWWMAIRRETTQNVREKMEIIMVEFHCHS